MQISHSTTGIIRLFTGTELSVRSWIATRPPGPTSTISMHAVVGPMASLIVESMGRSFLSMGWTMANDSFISPYTKVYRYKAYQCIKHL